MTHPETMQQEAPHLGLPAYKMQELAQIAWFIARALETARKNRGQRDVVRRAARDVQAGRDALRAATGNRAAATNGLPRPLDTDTFQRAAELVRRGPRQADVVSLSELGRPGWAVVGSVPGGRVGWECDTREEAVQVRDAILYGDEKDLGVWAVRDQPVTPERRDTRAAGQQRLREEYAAMVREMDRDDPIDRAVAHRLLHSNPGSQLDSALYQKFGPGIEDREPPAGTEGAQQSPAAQPSPQEQAVPPAAAAQQAPQEEAQPAETADPGAQTHSSAQQAAPATAGPGQQVLSQPQQAPQAGPQPSPGQNLQPAEQATAATPTGQVADSSAAGGTSQGNPVVRETVETAERGRINVIDLSKAAQRFSPQATGAGRLGVEYQDSLGEPLTEAEWLHGHSVDAVDTIEHMDPENPINHGLAVRWLDQGPPEVNNALQKKFPGLVETVRNRQKAANTAAKGTKATPAALAAARQRGEGQGGPATEQGTQRQTSRAAQNPAARRDAQHAQQ